MNNALHAAIRAALHRADQELDLMPLEERERHDWGDYLAVAVLAALPEGTPEASPDASKTDYAGPKPITEMGTGNGDSPISLPNSFGGDLGEAPKEGPIFREKGPEKWGVSFGGESTTRALYEALKGAIPKIKWMLTASLEREGRAILLASEELNRHVPAMIAALAKAEGRE